MPHRAAILSAALLLATLGGCATSAGTSAAPRFALRPTASDGQDLTRMNVAEDTVLESRRPGGIVSIQATDHLSSYGASFVLAARNLGEAPLVFGPENVSASADGRPVRVYTAEKLGETVQRKVGAMMKTETRSVSGTRRDLEAASVSATTDHTFNNYGGCPAGQGGCRVYDGTLTDYNWDENERQLNYETSRRAAAILAKDAGAVNQHVLKSAPIAPGGTMGGVVVLESPKVGETIDLVVTFGGQTHRFSYLAQKRL